MPKIQDKELHVSDIGKMVTYTPRNGGPEEVGRLSSYRSTGAIFVSFKGPNGEMCPPETLSWGGKSLVKKLVREAFDLDR